jgi:hypothetical protein
MAWHRIPSEHRTQKHLEKAAIREASSWLDYTEPVFNTYRVIMLDYLTRYDLSMNPDISDRCAKDMEKLLGELEFSRGFLKMQAGLGQVIANSLLQRTLKAINMATSLKNVCVAKNFADKKWANKFNLFEEFKKPIVAEIKEIIDLFERRFVEKAKKPVLRALKSKYANEILRGMERFEAKHR